MRRPTNASHDPYSSCASTFGKFRLLAGVAINTAGAVLLAAESYRYLSPGL